MKSDIFQIESEIRWEDLGGGIKRQIFGYDQTIMMVKVKFDAEAVGALHQHHHAQVTYVESGVFEVSVDGELKILKSGDGFYAPPNQIHGVVCKEAGVLIDVFSPYREDFLKK